MQTRSGTTPTNKQLEEASYYFGLLSEPTRLKILSTLCHGERAVNSIVDYIEQSQPNVSRQLNMLYRSKILARRKDGTQVYYRISDQKTIDLCQEICRKKAIALRNDALRHACDTCRLPDNRCSIGGGECHWQPLRLAAPLPTDAETLRLLD